MWAAVEAAKADPQNIRAKPGRTLVEPIGVLTCFANARFFAEQQS